MHPIHNRGSLPQRLARRVTRHPRPETRKQLRDRPRQPSDIQSGAHIHAPTSAPPVSAPATAATAPGPSARLIETLRDGDMDGQLPRTTIGIGLPFIYPPFAALVPALWVTACHPALRAEQTGRSASPCAVRRGKRPAALLQGSGRLHLPGQVAGRQR
ncbi:hypothetical protein Ntsu_12250 [Nocardia sp. IFM 10818]